MEHASSCFTRLGFTFNKALREPASPWQVVAFVVAPNAPLPTLADPS